MNSKILKGILIAVPAVYLLTLSLIYLDIYDKRPVLSLFKNLQSDSSLELVDFSLEKPVTAKAMPLANKDRNAYYGDVHVHTKYSFDAYVFGVTASPDDAYKYAKGEGISHPLGYEMKLQEPLDFYSVTDHGFYMGMIQAYADTSTDISKQDFAKPFHNLNRPENLTADSTAERANIFSSVLAQTIINPQPWWHINTVKAYFTKNIQLALASFDYDVHKLSLIHI